MPLYGPSAVSAGGISDSPRSAIRLYETRNSTQQLEGLGVHYGSVIFRGNFVPLRDGRAVSGLVNRPGIMRRANELGLGSVLLFAAAVWSCHAQAASDCAHPARLSISSKRRAPFTAWDSAGTWYAQQKDLRCDRRLQQSVANTPPILEDAL